MVFVSLCAFISITALNSPAKTHKMKVRKNNQTSDSINYARFFRLVVDFDIKSKQVSSERERVFLENFFREEANLSEEQFQSVKTIAYDFVNAISKATGKQKLKLSSIYKSKLRDFLKGDFYGFDEFIKTDFASSIIVLQSDSPSALYGYANISINESFHELRGIAGIGFNDVLIGDAPNISPQAACSVSATMSGPNVSESGSASSPDCSMLPLPNLTLISTAYLSGQQYCITGNFTGTTFGSPTHTVCLTAPSVPKVTSIRFEQIDTNDLLIDANPNFGNGLRIFPDDRIPNDPIERRKIRVIAKSGQIQAGINIKFLSYDLDDPFTDDMPIDPNGNLGNDNNGNVDNLPNTSQGKFSIPTGATGCKLFDFGISCPTNSNGEAVVEFTLTRQPGDNFAIAASEEGLYLGGIVVDGINLKDANNVQIPATTAANPTACATSSARACRTDMLTVWRRLHLEVDSMGQVQGNSIQGTFGETKKIGNSETFVLLNVSPLMELGRFDGGRLVSGIKVFRVIFNGGTSATIRPQFGGSYNIHTGDSFTLYDDDDFNGDDGGKLNGDSAEDILEPDMNLLVTESHDPNENALAPAYIKPVYDISNTRNNNTFSLNTSGSHCTQVRSLFGDWDSSNTNTDVKFWSVYVLGAYQAELEHDGDGSLDFSTTLGIVDWITNDTNPPGEPNPCLNTEASGALIFLETNRLRENPGYTSETTNPKSMAATVAHEIGHLLSCKHGEGEIMGTVDVGLPQSNKFSDISLDKIRRLAHP